MRLAWHYLLQQLKVQLAYRWDFASHLVGEIISSTFGLGFLVGVFGGAGATAIGGWSRDEILFIYGFSMLSVGLYEFFAEGLYHFSESYLIEGRLDQVLLRPSPALLHVLMDGFKPVAGTDLLVGGALLAWSGARLDLAWGPLTVLGAAGLAACGAAILSSVFLILTCASFWFEDRLGIQPPVYNCIVFGRYPIEIFPAAIRFLLRVVIPFSFIGYYPAGLFVAGGRWTGETRLLALSTPLVAAAFLALAIGVWKAGLRRYHSTGS